MSICTTIFNCFFSFVYCIFLLLAWRNIVVLFYFHIVHVKFMLVVIMYWGCCDYNRGHVPLLPVSPFNINCNCYLFFIALYWYIFVMLINPQFKSTDSRHQRIDVICFLRQPNQVLSVLCVITVSFWIHFVFFSIVSLVVFSYIVCKVDPMFSRSVHTRRPKPQ